MLVKSASNKSQILESVIWHFKSPKKKKRKHFENQNYIFKISTKGRGLMMKNNNFPTKRELKRLNSKWNHHLIKQKMYIGNKWGLKHFSP
jgi:hypothetical protein